MMPWLIDTDIFIEGERNNPAFKAWLEQSGAVATADIVRAEFLYGVHAVADPALRQRGTRFYSESISNLPSVASEPADYAKAASLAGDARRHGKGNPGVIDGLIAALALRTGARVATRNTRDFIAMGCDCENPLLSGQAKTIQ